MINILGIIYVNLLYAFLRNKANINIIELINPEIKSKDTFPLVSVPTVS